MSSTQLNSEAVPSHAQTQTLLLPPLPSLSPPSSRSVSFAFGTHASNLVHISRSTDPLMIELSKKQIRIADQLGSATTNRRAQSNPACPSLPLSPSSFASLRFLCSQEREGKTHKLIQRSQRRKLGFLTPNPKSQNQTSQLVLSFRSVSLQHQHPSFSVPPSWLLKREEHAHPKSLQVFGSSSDDVHFCEE